MTLDPLAACGVFGTLVTIISFIWAILVARQKLLVYEFTAPLPLAKSIHESERYRLSIIHEREGASPVAVKGAYISFVKLMNLGKETVQWSDVASPLKLEVSNTKVLDVTCANVSRGSIDFKVSAFEEINASTTTVLITFKFLDFRTFA